ncbi:hypothetical protein SVIOM74S_03435 [Streptomyces violarus]
MRTLKALSLLSCCHTDQRSASLAGSRRSPVVKPQPMPWFQAWMASEALICPMPVCESLTGPEPVRWWSATCWSVAWSARL